MIEVIPDLKAQVKYAADSQGIDSDLLLALVMKESSGCTWMVRLEPRWKDFVSPRDWASRLIISSETETNMQMCSWGLGQVMGAVAREHGFDRLLSALCIPEVGLKYSALHLKKFLIKYGSEAAALSAYNQGSPRKTPGGLYLNQRYVDDVCSRLAGYRKLN